MYKKWGRPRGLNLLLVTPADRELSDGWLTALGIGPDIAAARWAGVPFHVARSGGRSENACRITMRQLTRFFERGARPTEDWQRWLVGHKAFVIVDEFHRNKRWRHGLARAFEDKSSNHLAAWFRPGIGRRPTAPVWLLLSATPYNPVELDFQLDVSSTSTDVEEDVKQEVKALGREVKATLYALAALNDLRGRAARDAIEDLVSQVESALAAPRAEESVSIGRGPLVVVPGTTRQLRPRGGANLAVDMRLTTEDDVRVVAEVYSRILRGSKRPTGAMTLAERLILAGVRATDHQKTLEGHRYGRTTVAAVVKGALPARRPLAALSALIDVVQAALDDGDKVLVFCSHRGAATAASRVLRRELHGLDHQADVQSSADSAAAFNQSASPRVLVTTDVNSESVDLHSRCRTLVHFELPWTPLRVMQRYGRLWRLMPGGRQRTPRVFHIVHPGSVGEEILHRLRRRWGYLGVLGIDFVDFETALGTRIPQVPW